MLLEMLYEQKWPFLPAPPLLCGFHFLFVTTALGIMSTDTQSRHISKDDNISLELKTFENVFPNNKII